MRRCAAAVLAAAVLALGACGEEPTGPTFQVIEEVTFDPSLGIDLAQYTELPEGVWIRDVTVGTGAAIAAGSDVTMDYTGWLTSGVEFGSDTDVPFTYLGSGQFDRFIAGFEIGLAGLAQGGVRRIIIPPELGYGAQNVGPIPAGSILIFEVEAVTVIN